MDEGWFAGGFAGSGPWGFSSWQPILCYGKDPKLANRKGRHPDAIVHSERSEKNGHPCPKPIKFWSRLMERTSEPGDTIFEPFLGSGTALIAAEMTGRTVCAIEISPAYVDLSVARWEAFTGRRAFHEKTGEPFTMRLRAKLDPTTQGRGVRPNPLPFHSPGEVLSV
jgi:hypothetical protein